MNVNIAEESIPWCNVPFANSSKDGSWSRHSQVDNINIGSCDVSALKIFGCQQSSRHCGKLKNVVSYMFLFIIVIIVYLMLYSYLKDSASFLFMIVTFIRKHGVKNIDVTSVELEGTIIKITPWIFVPIYFYVDPVRIKNRYLSQIFLPLNLLTHFGLQLVMIDKKLSALVPK